MTPFILLGGYQRFEATCYLLLQSSVTFVNPEPTTGGADKSLAQPGRKQTTATKLRIYSTYSPRSSLHFLARCSNFCMPLKKSEVCPFNKVSGAAMTSASEKNGHHSIVFSIQGTGDSPTRPDPENMVRDQENGSPGRPVSSGLQVPGDTGHCRARTRPPW